MTTALKKWMDDERGRQARLAEATGLTPGYLSLVANGQKVPRLQTAQLIAQHTGLTANAVMGIGGEGFSEGVAAPYALPTTSNALATLIQLLAPHAHRPSAWVLDQGIPALSLRQGDVVIVELPKSDADIRPGQVVVANVLTPTGEARTRFALAAPPWLILGQDEPPARIGTDAAVLGVQLAVVRSESIGQ